MTILASKGKNSQLIAYCRAADALRKRQTGVNKEKNLQL